ncbi:hypothetical protein HHK36_014975 [Tetracentron sinense]|uniref:Uncharacterized protein n=2 Tax=Tetracentron sinense TaxID=13715 RepID=A0A834Z276_TETSI|nr:hypothetical protein HHK36_014975 [Tetracentron sinense]
MRVAMPIVTKRVCSSSEEDIELRRGPWTLEEDNYLIRYIACHGEGRWNLLAKCSGLKRTGKSCRLRWLNYLKPDVKRGNLTPQEQLLILELHSKWGNRIAQNLPGRTDNEIKNYWRTRVQKQARLLKMDSNSTRFRYALRRFWMPRLLREMEEPSPPLTTLSQNSSTPQLLNQASEESPPPPPSHGSLTVGGPVYNFNHYEKNSNSENCTSPIISSSDSINISQLPEISECPTSPPRAFGNTVYDPFLRGCYYGDISSDMESLNLASTSAPGGFEDPVYDCHMVESNWVDDDMADSIWNMDELWQLRKF